MTILDFENKMNRSSRMTSTHLAPPAFISNQVTKSRRFYRELRPRIKPALTVVCGGWEQCAPDYRLKRGDFPYWSLEFVAGGEGDLVLAGKEHRLERGVVFAYGPGVPHEIRTRPESPLRKYFVDFCGQGSAAKLVAAGLAEGVCRRLGKDDEVRLAFDQLIGEGLKTSLRAERLVTLRLETLLELVGDGAAPAEARAWRAFQTYQRCRDILEARAGELRTADAVAQASHVTSSHLSRLFIRFCGQPPYQVLIRLRMNQAAARLEEGGRLVREVADEFGLDAYHFSRVFKRVHGLSPEKFLKNRAGFGLS
jgi:AraC-like DNA-binding protein